MTHEHDSMSSREARDCPFLGERARWRREGATEALEVGRREIYQEWRV